MGTKWIKYIGPKKKIVIGLPVGVKRLSEMTSSVEFLNGQEKEVDVVNADKLLLQPQFISVSKEISKETIEKSVETSFEKTFPHLTKEVLTKADEWVEIHSPTKPAEGKPNKRREAIRRKFDQRPPKTPPVKLKDLHISPEKMVSEH